MAPRRQGVEYDVEPAGDRLLIVHNDGAEDFELAEAPLDATSHTQWTPGAAGTRPGVRILGVSAYASHAVVSLRRDGLTGLHVLPRDAAGDLLPVADVTFDEPLYVVRRPRRAGVRHRQPSGSATRRCHPRLGLRLRPGHRRS